MNNDNFMGQIKAQKNNPAFLKMLAILLVSVLLLVAAFLPIIGYSTEEIDGDKLDCEIDFNVSPLRNVIFFFDSLSDKEYDDLEDSDLYDDMEDIYEDLEDEIDVDGRKIELTKKGERYLEKLAYLEIRLGLQSEFKVAKAPFLLGALASLAYIAFAVVLFVLSLKNCLAILSGKEVDLKKNLMLLCAAPAAVILNYFASSIATYSMYFDVMGEKKIGVGTVLGLVFSLLAIAALIVWAIFFDKAKLNLKRLLVRSGILAVAFVALMTLFMPLATVGLEGKFGDRKSKEEVTVVHTAGYFGNLAASDDEKDSWDKANDEGEFYKDDDNEWIDSYGYLSRINGYANDEVKEYRDGENQPNCDTRLTYIFAVDGGYGMFGLLNKIPYLMLLMGMGFGTIMMYQFYLLITDEEKTYARTKMISVASVIAAVLVLGLIIAFVAMTMSDLDYYTGKGASDNVKVDFDVSVGVGAILSVLFGLVLAATNFVPMVSVFENNISASVEEDSTGEASEITSDETVTEEVVEDNNPEE